MRIADGSVRALFGTGMRRVYYPRWSPDGLRVSFTAPAPAHVGVPPHDGVYMANTDGSSLHLVADNFVSGSAAGSRDDQRLVFGTVPCNCVNASGGRGDLFTVSANGGDTAVNLTNNGQELAVSPDWSRAH